MNEKTKYRIITMSNVAEEEIEWLWYPYIPFGKITVIQGDGGDGKTTMALAIAAALTTGQPLPCGKTTPYPTAVIFQTSEDGLGDTVKPRLNNVGADCSKIFVIDESEDAGGELSLSDERIEAVIRDTGAKLFIIDPLQSYLGAKVDMHRANEVRPIMKRIGLVAESTGCAIVLIGHLNKNSANKSQYRGLGSIDIQAVARSVLTVGRPNTPNKSLRVFVQTKSNLAPEGGAIAFELDSDNGFRWVGKYNISVDELLGGGSPVGERVSTYGQAVEFLQTELANGEVRATELLTNAEKHGISERTLNSVKKDLSIKSIKRENGWHWKLSAEDVTDSTTPERVSTYNRAVEFLQTELANGEVRATELFTKAEKLSISEITLKRVKKDLAIESVKRDHLWYWKFRSGSKTGEV